uniref:HTH_Tnp_Tc3_1 domain-containing protein n=1 Tax=Heterorhabditis bacteriophora TaxID=37862 RepID=A0A1I7WA60_HETBA
MGRASILSLHKRGQIKALSTTGFTVKRIADVVKHSKKRIMNGRLTSLESVGLVTLMLQKLRCGECWTSKCPQLTQRHKDEMLCWAKIFMRCNWEKVRLLRVILSDEKKLNLDGPDGCY